MNSDITVPIILNPDAIIFAYTNKIKSSYEAIAVCLRNLEADSFSDVPTIKVSNNKLMSMMFSQNSHDAISIIEVRRWLLGQGLQDVIQGLSYSIMEALWFMKIAEHHNSKISNSELPDFESMKKVYEEETFGNLLKRLFKKFDFDKYKTILESLNEARSSLSHAECVRKGDRYPFDQDVLVITWLADQLMLSGDNGKVEELRPSQPTSFPGQLGLEIIPKSKRFKLGEVINISADEFVEIVLTGWFISVELASLTKKVIDSAIKANQGPASPPV